MPMATDKTHLQAKCEAAHKTLTPQRLTVLKALPDNGQPVGAYALQEQLNADGHAFNISTIYRVLDFWVSLGVVHKLNSSSSYLLCQDRHDHHIHVLQTCTDCHQVVEACDTSTAMVLPNDDNFTPVSNQTIEIQGRCRACQEA